MRGIEDSKDTGRTAAEEALFVSPPAEEGLSFSVLAIVSLNTSVAVSIISRVVRVKEVYFGFQNVYFGFQNKLKHKSLPDA